MPPTRPVNFGLALRREMSAQAVQQLRVPPSEALAHSSAVGTLNEKFPDAAHLGDLEQILREASANQAALEQQVRL